MLNHKKPFATIGAYVPRELYERLDEYCWAHRVRASVIIRDAVVAFLDAQERAEAAPAHEPEPVEQGA